MSQLYNLDLETMLSTLFRRQLSGSLVADVARGRVGRESAHIEIRVDSGKVVFCSLQSGRMYLTGDNALQVIAQIEMVPWIFTAVARPKEQQRLLPAQQLVPIEEAPQQQLVPVEKVPQFRAPKRLGTLQQTDLARLPRSHFQVYAYIDGRRTVEEIAQQLRATTEQIERILVDLQTWGVVQYK